MFSIETLVRPYNLWMPIAEYTSRETAEAVLCFLEDADHKEAYRVVDPNQVVLSTLNLNT